MVMDDDRGQLLLVGAFIIALVVVGTVVYLNGLNFNDSIGSQGNEQSLNDAQRTKGMVTESLIGLTERVRADVRAGGGGLEEYERELRENISDFARYYSRLKFNDGVTYVNVSLNSSETASLYGGIITQRLAGGPPNRAPAFINGNGRPGENDWEVARDVNTVTALNVTLKEFPCPTGNLSYVVEEVESGDTWEWRAATGVNNCGVPDRNRTVETYLNGVKQNVTYEDPGPNQNAELAGRTDLDIFEGTVNGTTEWQFAKGLEPPYNISVQTTSSPGNAARGSFRIETDSEYRPPTDDELDSDDAIAVPAVDIRYVAPELVYNSTVLLTGAEYRPPFLIDGWVQYNGGLIYAHSDAPGTRSVHEMNWRVYRSDSSVNPNPSSLTSVELDYTSSVDLSGVTVQDIRVYEDDDGDGTIDANHTADVEPSTDIDNAGDEIEIDLSGSATIDTGDGFIVSIRGVGNPSGETDVEIDFEDDDAEGAILE